MVIFRQRKRVFRTWEVGNNVDTGFVFWRYGKWYGGKLTIDVLCYISAHNLRQVQTASCFCDSSSFFFTTWLTFSWIQATDIFNMMHICRAEDGHVSQVSTYRGSIIGCCSWINCTRSMYRFGISRGDCVSRAPAESKYNVFNRAGSLELFLHQQTGVEEEAIIAYLSDGRRLRNDNIRDLAGAQDQVRAIDICLESLISYCGSRYSCLTSTTLISTSMRFYTS